MRPGGAFTKTPFMVRGDVSVEDAAASMLCRLDSPEAMHRGELWGLVAEHSWVCMGTIGGTASVLEWTAGDVFTKEMLYVPWGVPSPEVCPMLITTLCGASTAEAVTRAARVARPIARGAVAQCE
jgi:hypothetical protein